ILIRRAFIVVKLKLLVQLIYKERLAMYQGQSISVTHLQNGIAELIFDLQEESVNKFNLQTVSELEQALGVLESASDDIKGLLIRSAKDVFIVGADVMEFGRIFAEGQDRIIEHLSKNNQNFC